MSELSLMRMMEIQEEAIAAVMEGRHESSCPYPEGTQAECLWLDTFREIKVAEEN